MNDTHASEPESPVGAAAVEALLTPIEGRILASLFEKAATTPEQYPLTVNALQLACNQKNNREPLMQLDPGEIIHALRTLENRGWARQSAQGQRAQRWEHSFDKHLNLTPRRAAVICTLLLRGPQTLAEIHTRSERLAAFPDVEDVRDTLERLIERDAPLVVRLPRQPGQREERFMHLLYGPVDPALLTESAAMPRGARGNGGLEARIEALEAEVAELRRALIAVGGLDA
jgi:uncharacterized protein YceH (UPF0502 family)